MQRKETSALAWVRLIFSTQCAGDLGHNGRAVRKPFKKAVTGRLHGTDIPGLTVSHLEEAFEALRKKILSRGPVDGGYWLIGLKRADLFAVWNGAPPQFWRKRLQQHSIWSFLPCAWALTDMDTSEAVRQCMPEWAEQRPHAR
jgi:glycosyltransferase A (GT-A) superfamily protein (DUF2064 family)